MKTTASARARVGYLTDVKLSLSDELEGRLRAMVEDEGVPLVTDLAAAVVWAVVVGVGHYETSKASGGDFRP